MDLLTSRRIHANFLFLLPLYPRFPTIRFFSLLPFLSLSLSLSLFGRFLFLFFFALRAFVVVSSGEIGPPPYESLAIYRRIEGVTGREFFIPWRWFVIRADPRDLRILLSDRSLMASKRRRSRINNPLSRNCEIFFFPFFFFLIFIYSFFRKRGVLSREFLCGWRDGEFESRIFNAFLNVDGILWCEHDLLLWNNIYDRNARNIDEFLRYGHTSRLWIKINTNFVQN